MPNLGSQHKLSSNLVKHIFLRAKWEYLAMFNFEVDPLILLPHLPPHTQLDLWKGKAIVSVVGFLFNNTQVMGVKWPGFVNFEEVNLRYYIKYFDGREWKRGVGFISEIVPSFLVSSIANLFYNEHYSTAKMSHAITHNSQILDLSYQWKTKNTDWCKMTVSANPNGQYIEPGSEEEFIFEHYYGYNKLNETTSIEYSLAHPRWQVFPVIKSALICDIEKLYGEVFTPFIQNVKPISVFLAKGSDVQVKMPNKIRK